MLGTGRTPERRRRRKRNAECVDNIVLLEFDEYSGFD